MCIFHKWHYDGRLIEGQIRFLRGCTKCGKFQIERKTWYKGWITVDEVICSPFLKELKERFEKRYIKK